MTKYEYHVVIAYPRFHSGGGTKDFTKFINDLGNKGWEISHFHDGWYIIFKRKKKKKYLLF